MGEILTLTKQDVDMKKQKLFITKSFDYHTGRTKPTKTEKSTREIAVNSSVLMLYQKYIRKNTNIKLKLSLRPEEDTLFVNKMLIRPTYKNIRTHLAGLCQKLGIKKVRIHELRHTHASLLIAKGIPVQYVSERLGHADVTTTLNTYTHVISEVQRENDDIIRRMKNF